MVLRGGLTQTRWVWDDLRNHPGSKDALSIVGAERPPLISVRSQGVVVSCGSCENSRAGTHRPTLGVRQLSALLLCDAGNRIVSGGRNGRGNHTRSGSPLRECRV